MIQLLIGIGIIILFLILCYIIGYIRYYFSGIHSTKIFDVFYHGILTLFMIILISTFIFLVGYICYGLGDLIYSNI